MVDEKKFEISKELHKRHSRTTFEIIKEDNENIIVRVVQKKCPNENYSSAQELTEIAKELFCFYTIKNIIVHPVPYVKSLSNDVDAKWIKDCMNQFKIGTKELAIHFGLDKNIIKAMINDEVELGKKAQNMFYFYFKWVEAARKIDDKK